MAEIPGFNVDQLRVDLVFWMKRNGWTPRNINTALNRLHMPAPKAERIAAFIDGRETLAAKHLTALQRFIAAHPAPGDLDDFRRYLDDEGCKISALKDQQLLRRRYEAEDRRREHVRRLLVAERAPRTKPAPGPLFGLDKATIAALSGGTL